MSLKEFRHEHNLHCDLRTRGFAPAAAALSLPEHTAVEVRIISRPARIEKAFADRQRVYEALRDAGLIKPQPISEPVQPVSEAELAAAAEALAAAGPISELIIAERAESY